MPTKSNTAPSLKTSLTSPGNTATEILDACIRRALDMRASDIHLDPQDEFLAVRFRVDGRLQEVQRIPKNQQSECIARLKILSGLRTDEHFKPQDGRFGFESSKDSLVDVRLSVAPTYHGENAVLRLLQTPKSQYSLAELGFSSVHEQQILQAIDRQQGMVLVTGPTGSGKTSTLYACMQLLLERPVSVVSLEDPIEYSLPGASQLQINPQANFTFASGLRSILRQDPDILMIGEIRDEETAGLATNAALTGHLLMSTLHTHNSISTLFRLMDMGVPPYLLSSTLRLVIAQRLVRRICSECKKVVELSSDLSTHVQLFLQLGIEAPDSIFEGTGCTTCNGTGFRGRIGIFELLPFTSIISEMVRCGAGSLDILLASKECGMKTLLEDGIDKVAKGLTTVQELMRLRYE